MIIGNAVRRRVAGQYNRRVSQEAAGTTIAAGVILSFLAVFNFYHYVTDGASAASVWIPAGIGLVVTLAGVVIWTLRDPASLQRPARWLLLLGAVTFCVGAVGHGFIVFFLIAIPALILSAGVALVAFGLRFRMP